MASLATTPCREAEARPPAVVRAASVDATTAIARAVPPPTVCMVAPIAGTLPSDGWALRVAELQRIQRVAGNRAARRMIERVETGRVSAPGRRVAAATHVSAAPVRPDRGATTLQRLSIDDLIPDAILSPIRSLVGQVGGVAAGLTKQSDSAAAETQTGADAAAGQADTQGTAQAEAERARGAQAADQADTGAAAAEGATAAHRDQGTARASQLQAALPAVAYAADPVKRATAAPPAAALPGASAPVATATPGTTWNCDEAAVLGKVSGVGKAVLDRVTRAAKALVPEEVLAFGERGIAELRAVMGGIRRKVDAARQAVTHWIDDKLAPVRRTLERIGQRVSAVIDGARKAVGEKLAQAQAWAARTWQALKARVTSRARGAIDSARQGASSLLERAKSLAGSLWERLPDVVKKPLAGAAAALAAPIALAWRAAESAVAAVERQAASLRGRLTSLADRATKWIGERYQKTRAALSRAGKAIGAGLAWVRQKAADAGRSIYARIDALSGGQLSKWRAAAAARFAALKGRACAVTGALAGPCVERFVPEPAGGGGKSFASLTTKADITVPIEGVPVKVAAGATVKIERTARTYSAVLSGEGSVSAAFKLGAGASGGSGGGAAAAGGGGSVSVEGTLPNKALALMSLGGQAPALPAVPIPIGGGRPAAAPGGAAGGATATAGTPAVKSPAAASGTPPAAAAAPGGGGSASAEAGVKLNVALTYTFDATADKTSCDGLGGLTTFLATQGAAALMPEPFSHLAAAGGQAAFADKLTSAKVTYATTAGVSVKGGAGGGEASLGAKAEQGASLESKTEADKSRSLTATLFQGVSGEAAIAFAPGGIGISKVGGSLGGRQELAAIYNITRDTLDAKFKQALSGSVTLGVFAGMVGNLPPPVRALVQKILACLPQASEATVSFELSNNVVNLRELAIALDAELDKGAAATAGGVWNAVAGFVRDDKNSSIEFTASLALTEKVLAAKASLPADQVSAGLELNISRGQQIVICPPTRLDTTGGPTAAAVTTLSALPAALATCDDEELIKLFGNRRRDLGLDPDADPISFPRPDDPPILDSFRRIYNRLDSWNQYIRNHHADLVPDFEARFPLELNRKRWLDDLKERGKQYKEAFRDLANTDPDRARREYEARVLGDIEKQIDDMNRAIAVWYRAATGSTETIDEIIERVHAGGTEDWRAAWRAAILQVNRVLAEFWPAAKGALAGWVVQQRARLPHLDLSGGIGELDYIGSLATGYKGPPKQQVRFNPDKFDVDANLAAPPLAKYAMGHDHLKPDRQRIFGRQTTIGPLNTFSDQAHGEMTARVKGYDASDPFDVVIEAPELPEQSHARLATERLYSLRRKLPEAQYLRLLDELVAGGFMDADRRGVRQDLSKDEFDRMNSIMDRYGG